MPFPTPDDAPTMEAPKTNASESIDDLLGELNIPREDKTPRGFQPPQNAADQQPGQQPVLEEAEPIKSLDEYKLQAEAYVRTLDMGAGQFLKVYSKDKGNEVFNASDQEQHFIAEPLARVLQKHNVGTLPPELELIIRAGAVYFPQYQRAAELRKINILTDKVQEMNQRLERLEKAEIRAKIKLEKTEIENEEKQNSANEPDTTTGAGI